MTISESDILFLVCLWQLQKETRSEEDIEREIWARAQLLAKEQLKKAKKKDDSSDDEKKVNISLQTIVIAIASVASKSVFIFAETQEEEEESCPV